MIVDSEQNDNCVESIILRLGGLHLEMSFLGSIGHLMSGLKELLSTVYAEQTVPHSLSGKAISRAIRGHLLNSAALNTLLMSKCLHVPLPGISEAQTDGNENILKEDESVENEYCDDTAENILLDLDCLFTDLFSNKESPFDANNKNFMLNLYKKYNELISDLKDRTSKLWLLYLEMVDILCAFIKGERTGDWNLHLQSMTNMLPFLASPGHFNYLKSVSLYLQKMEDLEITHPSL